MKLEIFKEKNYDIIWINKEGVVYFKITKNGKVITSEFVKADLFNQGFFQKDNLESAIAILIKKYRINILGVVLNLPNILFQKITLPRTANPYEAILNYIKVSFPLSLEKYTFFYKEDKYKLEPTVSNFDLTFVPKEIIDNILRIIEKYNLVPLFITPSLVVIFQYIVAEPIIDFNGEYIIFFLNRNLITVFLVKNLRIEKVFIEEIDLDKTDLNLIINRFYNFLKPHLSPEGKILFFSDQKLSSFSGISHQQVFFDKTPLDIFVEGSRFIFEKVFADQAFIDFLPIRSYSAYLLNRLPAIINFVSIYLLIIFLLVSGIFLAFNFKLKNELISLDQEIKNILTSQSPAESEINQILEISKELNPQIIENFEMIKKIVSLDSFKNLKLESFNEIEFIIEVRQQDIEKTKYEISRDFPKIRLIQEETLPNNEVKVKYSF